MEVNAELRYLVETFEAADARHLRGLDAILDKPVLHTILVSMDPRVRTWEGSITGLPAPWLLSGNADSRHRHH